MTDQSAVCDLRERKGINCEYCFLSLEVVKCKQKRFGLLNLYVRVQKKKLPMTWKLQCSALSGSLSVSAISKFHLITSTVKGKEFPSGAPVFVSFILTVINTVDATTSWLHIYQYIHVGVNWMVKQSSHRRITGSCCEVRLERLTVHLRYKLSRFMPSIANGQIYIGAH